MTDIRLTIEHFKRGHVRTYAAYYANAEKYAPGEFGRVTEATVNRILRRELEVFMPREVER